ncbi:hypothetical protein BOTNAR_1556g00020 [Botryotinia narcissicola]|uniref:Uncharacterized protein n=1 Tax=Botryotinia narcissicola TaxID=278944 RepID=A0A4Z1HEV9_9HELO|nr:hypothetical protein BOTNAR_1556g00020 [Botryotinia narcissicola]
MLVVIDILGAVLSVVDENGKLENVFEEVVGSWGVGVLEFDADAGVEDLRWEGEGEDEDFRVELGVKVEVVA